eukprot:1334327-Rhodomonas_salina.5
MLEYYPGYSDPRYVPTGGYDAPYDLNGDGQYVDNWARYKSASFFFLVVLDGCTDGARGTVMNRVSTDWSCDQPTSGYIYPMPGQSPTLPATRLCLPQSVLLWQYHAVCIFTTCL